MEDRLTKLEEKVKMLTKVVNTLRNDLVEHILEDEEDLEIEEDDIIKVDLKHDRESKDEQKVNRCTRITNYVKNKFC